MNLTAAQTDLVTPTDTDHLDAITAAPQIISYWNVEALWMRESERPISVRRHLGGREPCPDRQETDCGGNMTESSATSSIRQSVLNAER
jgi:hypothetical protein